MGVQSFLKPWLDVALGFIYPNVCQVCLKTRAGVIEGYVCSDCWQEVRFLTPPFCQRCGLPYSGEITVEFECNNCREMDLKFRTARSAVIAKGVVREVILRYKYERALWFEPFLADLLVRQAAPVLMKEKCDIIVPVPLFAAKRREREFNQAERLARRVGHALNIPVNSKLLSRTKPTMTQTKLSRVERAENVRNAFALQPEAKLNGQRVVLLDDVFTTGATTNACARILLKAGAADVSVWTVARGL